MEELELEGLDDAELGGLGGDLWDPAGPGPGPASPGRPAPAKKAGEGAERQRQRTLLEFPATAGVAKALSSLKARPARPTSPPMRQTALNLADLGAATPGPGGAVAEAVAEAFAPRVEPAAAAGAQVEEAREAAAPAIVRFLAHHGGGVLEDLEDWARAVMRDPQAAEQTQPFRLEVRQEALPPALAGAVVDRRGGPTLALTEWLAERVGDEFPAATIHHFRVQVRPLAGRLPCSSFASLRENAGERDGDLVKVWGTVVAVAPAETRPWSRESQCKVCLKARDDIHFGHDDGARWCCSESLLNYDTADKSYFERRRVLLQPLGPSAAPRAQRFQVQHPLLVLLSDEEMEHGVGSRVAVLGRLAVAAPSRASVGAAFCKGMELHALSVVPVRPAAVLRHRGALWSARGPGDAPTAAADIVSAAASMSLFTHLSDTATCALLLAATAHLLCISGAPAAQPLNVLLLTSTPSDPLTFRGLQQVAAVVLPDHRVLAQKLPLADTAHAGWTFGGCLSLAGRGLVLFDVDGLLAAGPRRQLAEALAAEHSRAKERKMMAWAVQRKPPFADQDAKPVAVPAYADLVIRDRPGDCPPEQVLDRDEILLHQAPFAASLARHAAAVCERPAAVLPDAGLAYLRKYYLLARRQAEQSRSGFNLTGVEVLVQVARASAAFHLRDEVLPFPDCALAILLADQSAHNRNEGAVFAGLWGSRYPPCLQEALETVAAKLRY